MNILYQILIINILLIFKIWWDYRAKGNGRIINHIRSAAIDLTIYLISSYLLFKPDLLLIIGWVIISLSYRWILFDAIFAKINWGVWVFYGTSSWTDRQLLKVGKYHFLIKLIPLFIGLTLIVTNS